jgi:hypothetical protein
VLSEVRTLLLVLLAQEQGLWQIETAFAAMNGRRINSARTEVDFSSWEESKAKQIHSTMMLQKATTPSSTVIWPLLEPQAVSARKARWQQVVSRPLVQV